MNNRNPNNRSNYRKRSGVVLLVTLVLLVVLSILGYTLSSQVSAQRHRNQFIIDYQAARYGCDSATKYAFATLEESALQLISRPNEPDFSDLFMLSEAEYEELLAERIAQYMADMERSANNVSDSNYPAGANDVNGVSDVNEPNSLTIRGPYGPAWPFVAEPLEFKIGSATVRIEIEDENAKYPVCWAMLDDKDVQHEALAGLETFCEWMGIGNAEVDSLKSQLKEIGKIKPFKLDFKAITTVEEKESAGRTSRSRRARSLQQRNVISNIPASVHTSDFAKLFHSSLIDSESLAKPTIIGESRKESALKYMGLWGSGKVNINTAPRHVLEAAFTFGGDADKITEEIIQRRRVRPFTDIDDLKKALFKYSDSIGKCEKYITTVSNFFTIKVTAVSGVAEASAVIAVTKNGKKIERIAAISS
jgi:hypothetical protein